MKYAGKFIKILQQYGYTVSVAESCTGGMIASTLVDYAGISEYFNESYVTYSNEAKHRLLGVRTETLEHMGAVSEQCAKEMALGVKKVAKSDIGIATTGIAGPEGGTDQKPVGTVFIACAHKDKVIVRHYEFSGSRAQVRLASVKMAFKLAYDTVCRLEKYVCE